MTDLSPAAQAVLDAVEDDCIHPTDLHRIAAAALRAAADQVHHHWDGAECVDHLVALANALEAQ
jgi:hypothetical protein